MKVIEGSRQWREPLPIAVALGNFDGVHVGHQAILQDLRYWARKKHWHSAVYTFEPHPTKVLAPLSTPRLIQTREQKLAALDHLGIDFAIVECFNGTFSKMKPEKFFLDILVNRLGVKGIFVGYDFTFGHKRSGSVEMLKRFCQDHGILFLAKEAQFQGENLVSSTQIRSLVGQGEVETAQKLLGRPFALIGKVVKGHGLGAKLGVHTANLEVENELLPKTGIYITMTNLFRGASHPSVTSVGFNPTFPGKGFSVETHLLDFQGSLRGKKIEIAFLTWLRAELTFPNAETLGEQIRKDIAEAKKYHATVRPDR